MILEILAGLRDRHSILGSGIAKTLPGTAFSALELPKRCQAQRFLMRRSKNAAMHSVLGSAASKTLPGKEFLVPELLKRCQA